MKKKYPSEPNKAIKEQAIRKLREAERAKQRAKQEKDRAHKLLQEAQELRKQLPNTRVVSSGELAESGRWDAEYHLYGPELTGLTYRDLKEPRDAGEA